MSISETIIQLATNRGKGKTICPSEVARTLWPADWRTHMQEVRNEAFELQRKGQVQVTQKGVNVINAEVKGPIRIAIKQ
jgi:hypothetical protein